MKKIVISFCALLCMVLVGAYIYVHNKHKPKSSAEQALENIFNEPSLGASMPSEGKIHKNVPLTVTGITRQECIQIFDKYRSVEQLERVLRLEMVKIATGLQSKKFSKRDELILADLAGLPNESVRSMLHNGGAYYRHGASPFGIFLLSDIGEEMVRLDKSQADLLRDLSRKKSYKELGDAIRGGKLNPQATRGALSLLAHVIKNNRDITQEQLSDLIESGVPVKADALAFAIENKFSLEQIKYLVERNPQSIQASWTDLNEVGNVMTASAKYLRADLYNYFAALGASPTVEYKLLGSFNALDSIAQPSNEQERQAAEIIARSALQHNLQAEKYGTKERLRSVLSASELQQYDQLLQPKLPLDPQIEATAEKLKALIKNYDTERAVVQVKMKACADELYFTADIYWADKLAARPDASIFSLEGKSELFQYLVRDLKQYPEKRVNPELRSIFEALKSYPDKEGLKKLMMGIFEPMKDGRWENTLAAIDRASSESGIKGLDKLGYSFLINAYLKQRNPDPEMVALLQAKGAVLDFSDIQEAIRGKNLGALQNLQKYGLDLSVENEFNQNALDLAVDRRMSLESVEFLLKSGVSPKSSTRGPDALDKALENMDSYSARYSDPKEVEKLDGRRGKDTFTRIAEFPDVVDRLIRAGAPIEQSHIDQIIILKATNPDAYAKLLQIIPNLENLLPSG